MVLIVLSLGSSITPRFCESPTNGSYGEILYPKMTSISDSQEALSNQPREAMIVILQITWDSVTYNLASCHFTSHPASSNAVISTLAS
jgi:hypothetical protein